MQGFLVGIKDAEDIDGVSCFIDGEHDQVKEALHLLTGNTIFGYFSLYRP